VVGDEEKGIGIVKADMMKKLALKILERILKNPRKHRDIPQKYILNGVERGVNQNTP